MLELKELPGHLIYVFVGKNNTLCVIIVVDLIEWKLKAPVSVL